MSKFICDRTAKMYKDPFGGSYQTILILGDEVEIDGERQPKGGRFPVVVRGRKGWVSGKELGDERGSSSTSSTSGPETRPSS